MNALYKKIIGRLKSVAKKTTLYSKLKDFQCRGWVAISENVCGWLDISMSELERELWQHKLQCFYFNEATSHEDQIPDFHSSVELSHIDAVTYGMAIDTESIPSEFSEKHDGFRDKWKIQLVAEINRLRKLFLDRRPRAVIIVQGYFITNAAARWVAIDLAIPVIAVENTGIKTRMLWDDISAITTNKNMAANYYWKFREHVSYAVVDEYCKKLILETKMLKSEEHQSPYVSHESHNGRPTVLFIGQVYTDSSIIFGLADWHSPINVMVELCRWCKSNNHNLVIKLHPKELEGKSPGSDIPLNKMTWRKMQSDTLLKKYLDDSFLTVDHDNSLDTYSLIDKCSFAVTINSQAGLETAIRGKPIVVCGNAFYGNLGFTHDAPAPEFFTHAADCASRGQAYVKESRRFAYIFFDKYCKEKSAHSLRQIIAAQLTA